MPFNRSTRTSLPTADVQVFFKGLLILTPDDQDSGLCRVAIHNDTGTNHQLVVKVYERGTGRQIMPSRPITLPLTIGIPPFLGTAHVQKFSPGGGNCSDAPALLTDFCWTVDLKALHPNAALTNVIKASPGISLRNGVLFTAGISDPGHLDVTLKLPPSQGGGRKPWQRLAENLGANIYLNNAEKLELRDMGDNILMSLPDSGSIGSGYMIFIDNLPRPGTITHDDFLEYYNAITPIQPQDQFGLETVHHITLEANVDAPCMPSIMDGEGRH